MVPFQDIQFACDDDSIHCIISDNDTDRRIISIVDNVNHIDNVTRSPSKQRSYPCLICGKIFMQRSNKYRHMRSIHPYGAAASKSENPSTKPRWISCPLCGKKYINNGNKNRHLRTKHPEHLLHLHDEKLPNTTTAAASAAMTMTRTSFASSSPFSSSSSSLLKTEKETNVHSPTSYSNDIRSGTKGTMMRRRGKTWQEKQLNGWNALFIKKRMTEPKIYYTCTIPQCNKKFRSLVKAQKHMKWTHVPRYAKTATTATLAAAVHHFNANQEMEEKKEDVDQGIRVRGEKKEDEDERDDEKVMSNQMHHQQQPMSSSFLSLSSSSATAIPIKTGVYKMRQCSLCQYHFFCRSIDLAHHIQEKHLRHITIDVAVRSNGKSFKSNNGNGSPS